MEKETYTAKEILFGLRGGVLTSSKVFKGNGGIY